MRSIECRTITGTVASLFEKACIYLPADVASSLRRARKSEESRLGLHALDTILSNVKAAGEDNVPICQDTGTAVVFLELGQDARIVGGGLTECINEGVRTGYRNGYLRQSIVSQPFSKRKNTCDNTPAVIHLEMAPGNRLKISALAKGGGAENCSRLTVLPPSAGPRGIIDYVVGLINECGANACPPLIIGVGIGGTAEKTMLLAKRSLLRKTGMPNPDPETAILEQKILTEVNKLGIGPMGYGGRVTAMAVHIETFPCHMASLPVAVNIQCWCSRHNEAII
jgi:fumarate hydratase subunit alpha